MLNTPTIISILLITFRFFTYAFRINGLQSMIINFTTFEWTFNRVYVNNFEIKFVSSSYVLVDQCQWIKPQISTSNWFINTKNSFLFLFLFNYSCSFNNFYHFFFIVFILIIRRPHQLHRLLQLLIFHLLLMLGFPNEKLFHLN